MFQLVYISTARPSVDEAEVARILAKSRSNNQADRVSGLLVFDGKRFLQALEGDRELVESRYARIRQDHRHRAPVTLSEREIEQRDFGQWSMASKRVDRIDGDLPLAEMVDKLLGQVSDPNTRALFVGFARIERKAA